MSSESQKRYLKSWLGISRTRLFTAVTAPCLIGLAVAFYDGFFYPLKFLMVLLGLILTETANLLLADWSEYKGINLSRGKIPQPPQLAGSPMISPELLPLKYTLFVATIAGIPALLILGYFLIQTGWPILILLAIAVAIGGLYAIPAFPYAFFSTALLPPIIAFAAYWVNSGIAGWKAGLSTLPVLFISVGAIFTYRMLYEPRQPGTFKSKRSWMMLSYALCYVSLIVLALAGITALWTLLALLSLPIWLAIARITATENRDYTPATSLGVLMHFTTGILIAVGWVVA
jgi:1,4-dihydroxy-2-naphthoate octaprenyltransferase